MCKFDYFPCQSGVRNFSRAACCPQVLDVDEEEDNNGSDDEDEIDSELLVREFFKAMFPDSFDGVLPIRRHKARHTLSPKSSTHHPSPLQKYSQALVDQQYTTVYLLIREGLS